MVDTRRRIGGRVVRKAGHILLFAWLLVVLVPALAIVLGSLKSNTDIYAHPLSVNFHRLKWGNYLAALRGPAGGEPLTRYIANSVEATIVALALGMPISALAAYGLARSSSGIMGVFNRFFTFLITVPILVTLVPVYDLMGSLHLRNSPLGIALVYAGTMIPPSAILMRPYFAGIAGDIIEAARIDGAGELLLFRRIVAPMALPAIGGVVLLNLIWVWSELLYATILLVNPNSKTIPVGLLAFQGQYFTDLGVEFAGLLIAVAPLLLAYFVFSRRVTDGMAAGVLK